MSDTETPAEPPIETVAPAPAAPDSGDASPPADASLHETVAWLVARLELLKSQIKG